MYIYSDAQRAKFEDRACVAHGQLDVRDHGPCLVGFHGITVASLTANLEY